MSGALLVVRRRLGQLAMLGRELRGRRELDPLGLAERALGEGREPAQRLDLVAEQLDPHRPFLGRGVDVEDAAAKRELAPLLDLVDALVAALDEELGDVGEVDLLAAMEGEPGRPQGGVGDRLGERDRAGDDQRRRLVASPALAGQRVERGDPQPDEVGRRRDVGLVAGPARRVEADRPRREEGAEVARQVAGGAVVGGDQERRAPREALLVLEQRREQIRPKRRGDVRLGAAQAPPPPRRAPGRN